MVSKWQGRPFLRLTLVKNGIPITAGLHQRCLRVCLTPLLSGEMITRRGKPRGLNWKRKRKRYFLLRHLNMQKRNCICKPKVTAAQTRKTTIHRRSLLDEQDLCHNGTAYLSTDSWTFKASTQSVSRSQFMEALPVQVKPRWHWVNGRNLLKRS